MKKQNRMAGLFLSMALAASSAMGSLQPVLAKDADSTQRANAQVIRVNDFGADPAGIADSTPAVMQAIAAAKEKSEPVSIVFEKGSYAFYPDKAEQRTLYLSNTTGSNAAYAKRTIGILLEDMQDVTIDGSDSRFLFHDRMTPYAAIHCENVTFENFDVDFASPTCLELLTLERNEAAKTITYHIPESNAYEIAGNSIRFSSDLSPYTGQAYWTKTGSYGYTQTFDALSGDAYRGGANPFNSVSKIEDLGGNQVRFTYSSMPNLQPGLVFQSRDTTRDQVAGALVYSKNVKLNNLKQSFVHGFGILFQMCENIALDGVIFDTPENSARATSASADDLHISGIKGTVRIENCRFHNPHDDPINVHGTFLMVKNVDRANRKVTLEYQHNETAGFPNYFVGDEIEFSTKGNLIPVGSETYTVTAVDGPDGLGGTMGAGSASLNQIVLTLDKDIPAEVAANTHLAENITYTPDVIIANNVFDASPTRGILCTTRGKVLIENNVFDRMNMAGIYISCDGQGWYESGRSTDVTIRNNSFIRGNAQDIFIEPTNPNVSAANPVHRNIKIENNTFFSEGNKVLDAKSTQTIAFTGNKILRTDPFGSLNASSEPLTLPAGGSESFAVTKAMNSYNSSLFRFQGCSDITIANNTYDPGLKPGIELASTSASELHIDNDAAAVNAVMQAEDASILYVSSDPAVAEADASGMIHARKEGKATIEAWLVSGGRKFLAGKREVIVEAGSGAQVSLSISSPAESVKAGESLQLSASLFDLSGNPIQGTVSWSLLSAGSTEASALASINENGTLNALAGGLVLVRASSGSASAILPVRIEQNSCELADGAALIGKADKSALRLAENSLSIRALDNGLYNTQTPGNIVTIPLPESADKNDFEISTKLSGFTTGGWGCSGLYLFKDADNYVAAERKNRDGTAQKIAVVREANQSASESWLTNGNGGSSDAGADGDLYLKLKKSGDSVTGFVSTDGTSWNQIARVSGSHLGNDFKLAVQASTPNGSQTWVTFSDFQLNGDSLTVTGTSSVSPAAAAAASFDEASGKLSASVTGADPAGESLILWQKAEADGSYVWEPSMKGENPILSSDLAGKTVRAQVYVQKGTSVSAPVISNAITLPASLNSTSPAQNLKSSEARLGRVSLAINEKDVPLSLSRQNWFVTAETAEKQADFAFEALDPNASVSVSLNNQPLDAAAGSVSLKHGFNLFEIHVEAEDGVTIKDYRLNIFRTGDSNTALASLQVNGSEVPVENGQASLRLEDDITHAAITAVPVSEQASVSFYQDGKTLENGLLDLEPGSNRVQVVVTSETQKAPEVTELNLYKPDAASALLASASFDETVSVKERFEPELFAYTGTMGSPLVNFAFTAQEPEASLAVYLNDSKIPAAMGTGSLMGNASFAASEGAKKLRLEVTSPDGSNTAAYTWDLMAQASDWLSDLDWNSATSGDAPDNPVRKDLSCSGNVLTLFNGETNVAYEKGIGTHAASEIVYNIAGKGYTRFISDVGIDREINTSAPDSWPNASFHVYGDGRLLGEAAGMKYGSPLQHLDVDLSGVSELKLVMSTQAGNIWAAHGDFAGARLVRAFEKETLDLDLSASAGGEVLCGQEAFYAGSKVSLMAKADPGCYFTGWFDASGQKVSEKATYSFTLEANTALEARFEKDEPDVPELYTAHLEAAIRLGDALNENLNEYTAAGRKDFEAKLALAKDTLQKAENQTAIDDAARDLNQALLALRKTPGEEALNNLK